MSLSEGENSWFDGKKLPGGRLQVQESGLREKTRAQSSLIPTDGPSSWNSAASASRCVRETDTALSSAAVLSGPTGARGATPRLPSAPRVLASHRPCGRRTRAAALGLGGKLACVSSRGPFAEGGRRSGVVPLLLVCPTRAFGFAFTGRTLLRRRGPAPARSTPRLQGAWASGRPRLWGERANTQAPHPGHHAGLSWHP